MEEYIPVDVELAAMGYLAGPDGGFRVVHGLDAIARVTIRLGVDVWWGDPVVSAASSSNPKHLDIILAPELFDAEPDEIRFDWSHELGHCATGRLCEKRASWWQFWRFGELLLPVWMN